MRPVAALILLAGGAALCALRPGMAAEPFSITLPANANQVMASTADASSAALPVGKAVGGIVPTRDFSGVVQRQAWQLPGGQRTTLQLITPLRRQLIDAGFALDLDCETQSCGGFDFRFAVEVLPEPAMHVDLGDFRYVLATRAEDGGATQAVAILVSRSAAKGFVQIIRVLPAGSAAASEDDDGGVVATGPELPDDQFPSSASQAHGAFDPQSLIGQLETEGHAVLDDVSFESGSATLTDGTYPSLSILAEYLRSTPDRAIAIVGHTDATGGLDGNITLSRKRAAAVAERLTEKYGVPKAQVSADGVGFLSPRASNLTTTGRTLNRRVEVILTSTQ